MILDPNNTVQPETAFTLSHKWAICGKATCMRAFNSLKRSIYFLKTEKFGPAGLEQQKVE